MQGYHIQTKDPTLLPKEISKKKLRYHIHTIPNMNGSLNALGPFEKENPYPYNPLWPKYGHSRFGQALEAGFFILLNKNLFYFSRGH